MPVGEKVRPDGVALSLSHADSRKWPFFSNRFGRFTAFPAQTGPVIVFVPPPETVKLGTQAGSRSKQAFPGSASSTVTTAYPKTPLLSPSIASQLKFTLRPFAVTDPRSLVEPSTAHSELSLRTS